MVTSPNARTPVLYYQLMVAKVSVNLEEGTKMQQKIRACMALTEQKGDSCAVIVQVSKRNGEDEQGTRTLIPGNGARIFGLNSNVAWVTSDVRFDVSDGVLKAMDAFGLCASALNPDTNVFMRTGGTSVDGVKVDGGQVAFMSWMKSIQKGNAGLVGLLSLALDENLIGGFPMDNVPAYIKDDEQNEIERGQIIKKKIAKQTKAIGLLEKLDVSGHINEKKAGCKLTTFGALVDHWYTNVAGDAELQKYEGRSVESTAVDFSEYSDL